MNLALEEEDSTRGGGRVNAAGGSEKRERNEDESEDRRESRTEEEERNRRGNRGRNRGRAASWLITKRNLSEHHGNALSNIVSP